MKSTTRNAALAFGLAIAGGWSLGATEANAQSPVPTVPAVPARTTTALPPRTGVPATPRYSAAPTYYRQPTSTFRTTRSSPSSTNYESARRDLKLYKPWLNR